MAIWLPKALVKADICRNTEEAKEIISSGKLTIDDDVVDDPTCILRAGTIHNGIKPYVIFTVGDKIVEYIVPISK